MSSKPRFVGEKVRLGDVATYVNGYAFKPSDYSDSGLPIVRIQNLTGNAYRTNRYEGTLPEKFAIQDGDILISWSASLGVFEWNQGPAWLNQHIFRVVFNKAMIDKRFFVHQARFLIQKSQNLAHGATMKHLTKKVFETLPFLYLGLNNQITIAEQLDALDTQINRAKRQIRFLDNLAKSRFVEMFGDPALNPMKWDIGTIESYCDNLDSRRVPITQGNRVDGPYPYIGASGVVDHVANYLFDETLLLISEDGANLLARTSPIAFTISGKAWVNNHAHVLRCRDDETRVYLQTLINMLDISLYVSGSAQPKLSQKQMNRIPIMLPSRKLLVEFATFVSQVDKSGFAS